jgi:hypothetical protein
MSDVAIIKGGNQAWDTKKGYMTEAMTSGVTLTDIHNLSGENTPIMVDKTLILVRTFSQAVCLRSAKLVVGSLDNIPAGIASLTLVGSNGDGTYEPIIYPEVDGKGTNRRAVKFALGCDPGDDGAASSPLELKDTETPLLSQDRTIPGYIGLDETITTSDDQKANVTTILNSDDTLGMIYEKLFAKMYNEDRTTIFPAFNYSKYSGCTEYGLALYLIKADGSSSYSVEELNEMKLSLQVTYVYPKLSNTSYGVNYVTKIQ